VVVIRPLVGDEDTIERALFGQRVSHEGIDVEERWDTDAKMRRAALAKGYDSIVRMTTKAYAQFKARRRRSGASVGCGREIASPQGATKCKGAFEDPDRKCCGK